MNVFGERARSWRKARKRGVSPIIATILLVAITVVLAAVLYVLISGLTHGPSSAPLGTNFSWGVPVNATGTTTNGCGTSGGATHSFCYSIEIAGSSVSTSNFVLALRNAAGATVSLPATATVSVDLISPTITASGCVAPGTAAAGCVAYAGSTTGTLGSWTNIASFTGSVTGGFTVVIFTTGGAAVNAGMLGDILVAVGSSGYSGSVISPAFT